jgi:chemotaxis protein CheX
MSGTNFVEPDSVLPRSAWHGVLSETVIEVFSIMVGVNVSAVEEATRTPTHITGVVGIAGAIRANLIVQCSQAAAIRMASQMLGIAPDAPDAEIAAFDALGEICNIVAGYFKAKVGLGDACMLSVPTIISGQDYRFCSPQAYERLELPILYERDVLRATLEIAR